MSIVVIDLVCLNDFKLISTVFSLKATAPQLATAWIESIKQAQVRKSITYTITEPLKTNLSIIHHPPLINF